MAKGLNKAELIGRLGQDPEIRYTASGTAVSNMSVATNHSIKRDDKWEEQTEWHRVIAWGRTAEVCGEYLRKGSQVYISGRLQTRSWEDKEGVKRWATEIVVQDVIFLSDNQGQKSNRPPAPPQEKSEASGQAGEYDASKESGGDDFGGMEGDVPF